MELISMGGLELRFLQSREATGADVDMFEMTVQPQARMPVPHYHENWDEAVYGLAGVVTFTVAGAEVPLGPGESLFIRRGVVHGFRNDGPAQAKCLCLLTPAMLGPAYFREMAKLLARQPPDKAAMGEVMRRYGLVPVMPA
ncbi:cupin domain-containing protein [Dankookia sp. GCM10030260]|uniref:cupin domain-containing protein n=1 Tax=Dankookia sp. GCM10030260 TaxID=3273390 RepID=UPI003614E12B